MKFSPFLDSVISYFFLVLLFRDTFVPPLVFKAYFHLLNQIIFQFTSKTLHVLTAMDLSPEYLFSCDDASDLLSFFYLLACDICVSHPLYGDFCTFLLKYAQQDGLKISLSLTTL